MIPGKSGIPDLAHVRRLLDEAGTRHVPVGGFGVVAHGYPRFSPDIGLFVEAGRENGQKVLSVPAKLPDGAARELSAGYVEKYGAVRIGNEVPVDRMKQACGADHHPYHNPNL